jgi:hypothetical protein
MPKEGKNKLMGNIYVTALTLARGKEKKKTPIYNLLVYPRARCCGKSFFCCCCSRAICLSDQLTVNQIK